MSEAAVLSLRGLSKSFTKGGRTLVILEGVDFDLPAGETAAILGASGAGKSTLLHLAGGLDRPDRGEVLHGETELGKLSEAQLAAFRGRGVGFVFQLHYLLPEFTCLENVAMPAFIAGRGEREAFAAARELLGKVGLGDRLEHRPGELSGGEQQRAAVARALVNRPPLVLADEPTGNLDAQTAASVQELFLTLNREMGTTFLIVTHDRELASRLHRRYLLRGGRLEREVG